MVHTCQYSRFFSFRKCIRKCRRMTHSYSLSQCLTFISSLLPRSRQFLRLCPRPQGNGARRLSQLRGRAEADRRVRFGAPASDVSPLQRGPAPTGGQGSQMLHGVSEHCHSSTSTVFIFPHFLHPHVFHSRRPPPVGHHRDLAGGLGGVARSPKRQRGRRLRAPHVARRLQHGG